MKLRLTSFMLFCVLALASCAPSLLSANDPDSGAGFKALGSPPVLWFSAGLSDVVNLYITIKGNELRINAPEWCKAAGPDILCTVPTLPAGKNFVLPMKGSNISAVALYKRQSGTTYRSEVRQ